MYLYFFLAVSSCYLFRIIHLWLPWVCRCGWLSAAAVSGLLSSCGARASHRGGFSGCRQGLQGTWASVVVVHTLSCPTACGIFPKQVLNLCPLYWQADSYPLYHQESPRKNFFLTNSPYTEHFALRYSKLSTLRVYKHIQDIN